MTFLYRRPKYKMDRDAALRDWILAELHHNNVRRLAIHSTNVCGTDHTIVELVDTLEFFSSKM